MAARDALTLLQDLLQDSHAGAAAPDKLPGENWRTAKRQSCTQEESCHIRALRVCNVKYCTVKTGFRAASKDKERYGLSGRHNSKFKMAA